MFILKLELLKPKGTCACYSDSSKTVETGHSVTYTFYIEVLGTSKSYLETLEYQVYFRYIRLTKIQNKAKCYETRENNLFYQVFILSLYQEILQYKIYTLLVLHVVLLHISISWNFLSTPIVTSSNELITINTL